MSMRISAFGLVVLSFWILGDTEVGSEFVSLSSGF
jgi:hypothetical protein